MSLVEVMVSMGVASALTLGILDLVQLSQRSVQNVTTLTDWNLMLNSVQQLIGNSKACAAAFAGQPFSLAAANNLVPKIQYNPPTGAIIAQSGAKYQAGYQINANGIVLACDAACIASKGTVALGSPSTTYFSYNAFLQISGVKLTNLAARQLGSQTLSTPAPGLGMSVLVDPVTKKVFQCNGTAATQSAICSGLGGTWTNNNVCEIGAIRFFSDPYSGAPQPDNPVPGGAPYGGSNFSASYPSGAIPTGQRIQLWGDPKNPLATDYGIGMSSTGQDPLVGSWFGALANDRVMWFNTGGANGGNFTFHTHTTGGLDLDVAKVWGTSQGAAVFIDPTAKAAASLYLGGSKAGGGKYGFRQQGPQLFHDDRPSDPYGNSFSIWTTDVIGHLQPSLGIDNEGATVILPSSIRGNISALEFGDLTEMDAISGGYSGEYISSNRNSGAWNLAFYQGYTKELELTPNRDVYVTPGRNMQVTATGGYFNSLSNSFYFRTNAGDYIAAAGGTTYEYATNNLWLGAGSQIQVTSPIWLYSMGGNVNFGCQWVSNTVPPFAGIMTQASVSCGGGMHAVAGGGSCFRNINATNCPFPQDWSQLFSSEPSGSGWIVWCVRTQSTRWESDPAPSNTCNGFIDRSVHVWAYCCNN